MCSRHFFPKHLLKLVSIFFFKCNVVGRQERGLLILLLTAAFNITTYSADNKRRTRYAQKTMNPEWNQTVIYKNIHLEQVLLIKANTLELNLIGVHKVLFTNIFCTIKHTFSNFSAVLTLLCN